jgi:spermidine synthase
MAIPTPTKKIYPNLAEATVSEADAVRYLHLGTPWVQGAMRIRKPLGLELEYIQRMMVWMLLKPEAQWREGHAVQLGLGAAAITRFTFGAMHMRTTAVELNPSVILICRWCFKLPEDSARLKVLEMDAEDYVGDAANANTVDALCVDLYDQDAASPMLDSELFYRQCFALLREGGVMTVNLFGRDASFERSAKRVAKAFGFTADSQNVFSMQPTKEGNTTLVAMKGMRLPERDVLVARADNIKALYKLPAPKWVKMIRPFADGSAPKVAA